MCCRKKIPTIRYSGNQMPDNNQHQNQTGDKDEFWRRITVTPGVLNCAMIVSITGTAFTGRSAKTLSVCYLLHKIDYFTY